MTEERNAEAYIKDGAIVVRLSIESLPDVVKWSVVVGKLHNVKVLDASAFARDVVRILNDEDETGETAVHRMFDSAFDQAIENGADGVDEYTDAEMEEMGLT